MEKIRARTHDAVSSHPTLGDDGGFGAVEAVIVIPVLVLLTMLSVQFAIVWHSRHIADAAARDGVRVARGYEATSSQGMRRCVKHLDDVAGNMLDARACSVERGNGTVSVQVHASVVSVLPFGSFSVDEVASGPIERFADGS